MAAECSTIFDFLPRFRNDSCAVEKSRVTGKLEKLLVKVYMKGSNNVSVKRIKDGQLEKVEIQD